MPEPHDQARSIPQGMTPLVQMFPMHIGDPAPASVRSPQRSGQSPEQQSPERGPNQPGRAVG